jgi:hypothetical protein
MKVYTSTAPLSDDLKAALSAKSGRDSLLQLINRRAAGLESESVELHSGDKVFELSVEPIAEISHNDTPKVA